MATKSLTIRLPLDLLDRVEKKATSVPYRTVSEHVRETLAKAHPLKRKVKP